jgi:hypothetical protein
MRKETEARWVERIREWRASGLSAEEFALGKGYTASTLCWAASLLRRKSESAAPTTPVAAEVHSRGGAERRTPSSGKAPRFLPVRTRAVVPAVAEVVIEIGAARVRVCRGFDASLLGEVVRALCGVTR